MITIVTVIYEKNIFLNLRIPSSIFEKIKTGITNLIEVDPTVQKPARTIDTDTFFRIVV